MAGIRNTVHVRTSSFVRRHGRNVPAGARRPAVLIAAVTAVVLVAGFLTFQGTDGFSPAGMFTEQPIRELTNGIPASYMAAYELGGKNYEIPWVVLAGIGAAGSDHGQRNPYGDSPKVGYPEVDPPIEGAGYGPMLLTNDKRDAQSPQMSIDRAAQLVHDELDKVDVEVARKMVNDPFSEENHNRWVKLLEPLPIAWEDMKGAVSCGPDTAQASMAPMAGAATAPGSSNGLVGASMFGGPDRNGDGRPDGGDDNGKSAYGGSNYVGYASWAELSTNPNGKLDYAALGDLPQNTVLKITSPQTGKTILAGKRDRGAGGKAVTQGGVTYPKKVDLWWQAAAELGLPGWETGSWSGLLTIEPAEPGAQPTKLSVVDNAGNSGAPTSAGAAPIADGSSSASGPAPADCAPAAAVPGAAIVSGALLPMPGGAKPSVNSYEIPGFTYPLISQDDHFIDSYGYARSGGRSHEGTDIMAPRGTPIVAPEDGTVSQVGTNGLGGNRMWVSGVSGYHYYLAHLNNYAPGMAEGTQVKAGQLVGYVGNTGSGAQYTDPHLHIEIHWPQKSTKPTLNAYVALMGTPEGSTAKARGYTANTAGTIPEAGGVSATPGAVLAGGQATGGGSSAAMNEARALFGLDPIGGTAGTPVGEGSLDAQQLAQIGGMSVEAATAYIEGAKRAKELVPGCAIDPLFLAGFGKIESAHGTLNKAKIGADGMVTPQILGPPLDGSGVGGNTTALPNKLSAEKRKVYGVTGQYDQAVGPMQFLGSTFDGLQPPPDFDGKPETPPNPHSYFDATLGAAILLCDAGNGLQDETSMRKAAFSYNRSSSYVDKVMAEYLRLKAAMPAPGTSNGAAASGPYAIPVDNVPADRLSRPHHSYPAWDFATPVGTPVKAVTSGIASRSNGGACGTGVSLKGDDGGSWLFCHGSKQIITDGQRVTAGQAIMVSGNTGSSSGPHLHLQLKINGEKRCVTDLLSAWGQGKFPPISTARNQQQAGPGGTCFY